MNIALNLEIFKKYNVVLPIFNLDATELEFF